MNPDIFLYHVIGSRTNITLIKAELRFVLSNWYEKATTYATCENQVFVVLVQSSLVHFQINSSFHFSLEN